MLLLTLDSSVFVAAFRETEEKHVICKKILEGVFSGKFEAIEPYSVLVEVVAAIKRRTHSMELAQKIKSILLSIDTINFEELISFRSEEAADLAISTGIRGMDALIIQTAKENGSLLVSLDQEMLRLVKGKVSIKNPEDLV
ncbi:hypothetical protein A2526_05570 [candidate division WOR-1 bacterium RIFOXYD2_FULL_36_8]|uniref:PIN domain-containing protein n=1 Tax=candidate division WOR-1 bacterium RIFOXYB2_FULL_36_35 TaxID=1802578 RepID=A0A1F4RY92_UNCSA|nr:MAG: hypothetical protein A2230_04170 [candidate division WOR-1 bacterium RIFOXYA2_FULL_36_21]OGC13140.1 MAG: hypothetical protein A2290_07515 [candidate division WOR-1 bacterium RIFOXYB2_FULL_36_35]OGC16912.1 MAG: hypothetical protein A2282_05670 [candidate division WOR-1 bacterium RIFOXYA12_FULL_36_13]OGC40519.1 MAG: hypothetical protein A2526_05570 [candidate division WOR-1 bacterium RIFOXYD2_FULL_36_8]